MKPVLALLTTLLLLLAEAVQATEFHKKRNGQKPTPGPLGTSCDGTLTLKVW